MTKSLAGSVVLTVALTLGAVGLACVGDEPEEASPPPSPGTDAAATSDSSGGRGCAPTERTCVGKEMRGCNADGTGFDPAPLDTCETPELCASGLAAGKCTAPACAIGEITCRGKERVACRDDRTDFSATATQTCAGETPECTPAACVACIDDAKDCNGKTPRTCTNSAWVDQTECSGFVDSTCITGACLDSRVARWPMPNAANSSIRPARYTVVSPEIARDEVTKLEWQRGVSPGPQTTVGGGRGNYCRGLALGGNRDWRLPSAIELLTLLDPAKPIPRLDTTIFSGTPTGTSAPGLVGGESNVAPRINFDNGLVERESTMSNSYFVRCVRNAAPPPAGPRFTTVGGEVTDNWTSLVWMRGFVSGSYYTLSQLGGRCVAPFRLPTEKELYTIFDPSRPSAPYIDQSTFPGDPDRLWTDTDAPADPTKKISIDFISPVGESIANGGDAKIRCVK